MSYTQKLKSQVGGEWTWDRSLGCWFGPEVNGADVSVRKAAEGGEGWLLAYTKVPGLPRRCEAFEEWRALVRRLRDLVPPEQRAATGSARSSG